MSDKISVSGKLPAGDGNGLYQIVGQLIREAKGQSPKKLHAVIALVDVKRLVIDADDGSEIPQIRLRRVEVLVDDDLEVANKLVRRALDQRSAGGADGVLPFELEQELEEAFKLAAEDSDGLDEFGSEEADPALDQEDDDDFDPDDPAD